MCIRDSCGCHVRAYYAASPFQPAFELEDAKKLAVSLKAEMTILPLNVLELSAVRENPSDRCYHCKNAIFSRILEAAEKDGFLEIMDCLLYTSPFWPLWHQSSFTFW